MATDAIKPTHLDNTAPVDANDPARTWKPLRLLGFYRLFLSGSFAVLAFAGLEFKPVGDHNPTLFRITAIAYLATAIINAATIAWRRPDFTYQVYSQVVLDIIAITLIMHASGSVKSGLGMLLIIAVVSGSILLAGQAAVRLAAIATLFMLGEHVYFQLTTIGQPAAYTHAGLLGASFFATALLAHALAKRIRASEALAAQRGSDLANMEQLAAYVIQRMQTGIIVVDGDSHVWQLNESGQHLLGKSPKLNEQPLLRDISPTLDERYQLWQLNSAAKAIPFHSDVGMEILPRFASLGSLQNKHSGTLIFLENLAETSQQAQQLKLASLGRLAGSIAHEIRNPLGAISHASQLLSESSTLEDDDLRLTEIIRSNCKRMNSIIENVLQLGRRQQATPETISLKPWLQRLIDELSGSQNLPQGRIQLSVQPEDMQIEFDVSQLHQILWNLCQNGIRHSTPKNDQPYLEINAYITVQGSQLDIIDYGPGISDDDREHIFEPFFTTESKGTGLGLYIAKELSECNYARLSYARAQTGGSCFKLTFANHGSPNKSAMKGNRRTA